MTDPDWQALIIRVFVHLRRVGFHLGVGELLAALRALSGKWNADTLDEQKKIVQLIWCKSLEEIDEFDLAWERVATTSTNLESETNKELPSASTKQEGNQAITDESAIAWSDWETGVENIPEPELTPFPIRAPFIPLTIKGTHELNGYWPVSRRFMSYAWKYLRRPIADGPADVLNIQATVERAAKQGFFLGPVYSRQVRNHAHLVLLLDYGGSMTPFHRLSRNVADTAQHESDIGQVDVFYFHNVMADDIYLDQHLTEPISLRRIINSCTDDTSVLIVSDAGAARGYRKLNRISATTEFLHSLKRYTNLIAWLNPMPKERWAGTSAQIIAHLIPMFQMDADGVSNAIDVMRGHAAYRLR
jgi:uncharacterized protein with von Willebrand factor type A (vWA) domain